MHEENKEEFNNNFNSLLGYFYDNISYISYNDNTFFDSLKYTVLVSSTSLEFCEFLSDSINKIILNESYFYSPKDYLSCVLYNLEKLSYYGSLASKNEVNFDFLMLLLSNIISNVHLKETICDHEFIDGLESCSKCKAIKLILYKLATIPEFLSKFDTFAIDLNSRFTNFNTIVPELTKKLQNNQVNYIQAFISALCQYGSNQSTK